MSILGADVLLCVLYTALNAVLNFTNRNVLGKTGFTFPVTLTAAHMLLGTAILLPIGLMQTPAVEHKRLLHAYWKELAFVGAMSVIQISLNNASLVHIELSMNQVVRALLPIMVSVIQTCQGVLQPFGHLLVLALVSVGVTMVVYTPDHWAQSGHMLGTFLVTLSVAMQAMQMSCAHRLLASKFDSLTLTLYTSPFAFLVALGPAIIIEGHGFGQFMAAQPKQLFYIVVGTSIVAAVYNVVVTQTIKRLSAVGSAVLGNVKVVAVLMCSSFFLGEMKSWTGIQLLGAAVTFTGAAVYSMLRVSGVNNDDASHWQLGMLWRSRNRSQLCALFLGTCLAIQFGSPLVPAIAPLLGGSGLQRPGCALKTGVDPCRDIKVDPALGTPVAAPAGGETVLITGGSGFIGSHLVEHLLELGYTVRVFDNLETGNLLYLDLMHERLEFYFGDILDLRELNRAMVGVSGVFHLGAASKVLPSLKSPDMATFNIERNAVGTSRVLQAANATKAVRKVMYAASSTYYGNQPVPFEESDPFMPTSPYAASKYMGELEMLTNDLLYHMPTLSLRFFMVYGPRNPSSGAYAIVTGKFIGRMQEGQPLMIEGSGENFRDFVHAKDIARALILGYQSDIHGVVINAGTGKTHSVKEVANLVSDQQVHVAARKNDLLGTLADTCKAKHLLNFEARYDFIEVMKEMIADARAGRADYLAKMWSDSVVHEVFEAGVPNWSRDAPARENSARIKDTLQQRSELLGELLAEVRRRKLFT